MSTATGFVGLGLMGEPMARNLVRAGFPLTVYNRTRDKSAQLEADGASVGASLREVGERSEVVVLMVSDDAAVADVLFGADGVVSGLAEGGVIVDMSTTSTEAMEETGRRLGEHGIALVDAPVFGSTEPAATGELWAVVGAEPGDLERVRPTLEAMCGRIFALGPVGAGSSMKVAGNLIVTGMLTLLAESLSMGERRGLDRAQMLEVVAAIDFASPLYTAKGTQVIDGDFAPRFPLKHALKDSRLAAAAGRSLGLQLRTVDGVVRDFEAAAEAGHRAQLES
jgi:3-hydroxyisobutyrate dehydrogenase-like beta-hydroxyacid dehydrogenase